jgi:agmatinase
MRRVLEVTDRLAQVGIRNYSLRECLDCPRQVERFITPAMIETDSGWIDRALSLLGEKVYVTVDVDGFDPAYVPGTGTPEPGGLSWRQVTALLRRTCAKRQVVSADIVEVVPVPGQKVSEFLAARLAYKIIAYTQSSPRPEN